MIVHDHFDDREHGREIAAPQDGDDGDVKTQADDVEAVGEGDFEGAIEVVHGSMR